MFLVVEMYRWMGQWSDPTYRTMWIETQAIATIAAFIAAGWYAMFTRRALSAAVAHTETDLMLTLMDESDRLRDSVEIIQAWYRESAESGADPVAVFKAQYERDMAGTLDEHRFLVSRFFAKIRKLSLAGFLDERLIAAALSPVAIQDVFLNMVDPLDQVIARSKRGTEDTLDRIFFTRLMRHYPAPAGPQSEERRRRMMPPS